MTTDQSIFNEQNPATQPNAAANAAPNAQGSDDLANLLGSIKNERGEAKYASVEAALVGLRNAQEYIPQLTAKLSTQEQELKTAREEAARVAELQRTIEALTSGNQGQPNTQAPPSFSKEDIAKLVNQTLSEQQQEVTAKSNVATVVSALQAKFGTDAEKAYNTKAAEIGMTVAELNALAQRNPKAVFTLLGVTQEAPKQMSSNTQPSFNTDGFQPAKDSFIGRNAKPSLIGATTSDLNEESHRAKQMVEELHSQGKTISDLTNPKVYFKTFK